MFDKTVKYYCGKHYGYNRNNFKCGYPADTPKINDVIPGKITSTQFFLIDKGILQWCAKGIVISNN